MKAAAAALYRTSPSAEDAAAMGYKSVEEMLGPPFGVFTDNWPAARLFTRMGSQWRVGPKGPTGLDFNVLYHRMDRLALTPAEYEELEEQIMQMERVALRVMKENQR